MNGQSKQPRAWKATGPLMVGMTALLILVGVIGVWAVQARIAGAVIASGNIEVESNRQVLQHPQGGVVGALPVQDGDFVNAGDTVLRFDDTQLRSELAIIEGQLFEILARKARLKAERDGLDALPLSEELAELAEKDPSVQALIDGQAQLFEARATSLQQSSEQILEQIAQAENQIEGATAQLAALETQRGLIEAELTDSQTLFDKGLAPASRVSSLQREQARLLGEIGSITASVAQLRGEIASLSIERIALTTRLREEAISTLRDLQFQEVELVQRRLSTMETLSRMELRAPVSGVIYGSRIFALQSVVSPAEPIMYIIPQDQPMVVAARVDPIHIDQVHVGQEATLRFAAFDQRLTPEIIGHVVRMSADVFTDEVTGMSYYEVKLVPKEGESEKLGGQVLLPGMPVEAFIKTAERSPLNYLAKPLTDYFTRAFREG
ncbi:HlyD family type I secretion periplasmic adaptor subunit [Roseobacter denitrificans]|uniref:Membrane fusion protein (MFP) family protein n=1 Tax=Roseobacter denitrificans (strain ATCC 33942 / OCh 114) TaxID=375451 RepID=Q169K0_ROSDO|nr:HlyD family type I secretion periplasmic adaptor subunit [Roseobacter denitrificans]ABG31343.1 type I secretion membrane fusion protein, HlyD family, putative [Roseobacter denitrificans OCh 114]AVL54370.1 HlyD family type I secretion periplasmic adaptor subunit [Roseobacter denitrificans]SFF99771.1 HlyD family secretion protein [Roseobacter denitrificans OCh 114]